MAWYDNKREQGQGSPYPGNEGSKGGSSFWTSFEAHAPGKHVEVTVHKGPSGEPKAVFVRDLFLGLF